jgi:peroxiredoxin
MSTNKLAAGDKFPTINIKSLNGEEITLGSPKNGADWQMVVVYRGKHCPLCTKYLAQIHDMKQSFLEAGVDIVVVSADTKEKANLQANEKLSLSFDIGYDLSIEQMKELGVYISNPRSPQETDRPFAEPSIFIVNEEGNLHIVDISNNPFVRPELEALLSGINWIRNPENNYPIRGTYN